MPELQIVPPPSGEAPASPQDALYADFARSASSKLSAHLRAAVEVQFQGRRSLTAKQLTQETVEEGCWVEARLEADGPSFFVEIARPVAFAAIEYLAGGKGREAAAVTRELTQIEKRLLEEFICFFLRELALKCAIAPAGVGVQAIEMRFSSIAPRLNRQPLFVTTFQTQFGSTPGALRIIASFEVTTAQRQAESSERTLNPDTLALISPARIDVEVSLDPFEMNIADLQSLKPEQVIRLAIPLSAPVHGSVNGQRLLEGRVVSTGSHRAFRMDA